MIHVRVKRTEGILLKNFPNKKFYFEIHETKNRDGDKTEIINAEVKDRKVLKIRSKTILKLKLKGRSYNSLTIWFCYVDENNQSHLIASIVFPLRCLPNNKCVPNVKMQLFGPNKSNSFFATFDFHLVTMSAPPNTILFDPHNIGEIDGDLWQRSQKTNGIDKEGIKRKREEIRMAGQRANRRKSMGRNSDSDDDVLYVNRKDSDEEEEEEEEALEEEQEAEEEEEVKETKKNKNMKNTSQQAQSNYNFLGRPQMGAPNQFQSFAPMGMMSQMPMQMNMNMQMGMQIPCGQYASMAPQQRIPAQMPQIGMMSQMPMQQQQPALLPRGPPPKPVAVAGPPPRGAPPKVGIPAPVRPPEERMANYRQFLELVESYRRQYGDQVAEQYKATYLPHYRDCAEYEAAVRGDASNLPPPPGLLPPPPLGGPAGNPGALPAAAGVPQLNSGGGFAMPPMGSPPK